mmetsp:Transcript_13151/g.42857  ORF Transcript_13151/g.42857 Transcript_13151/m.42857 type:complete len:129 (+) Transcript_13151:414-800(+)
MNLVTRLQDPLHEDRPEAWANVNVFFVVVTAVRDTYLSEDAIRALLGNPDADVASGAFVDVEGTTVYANLPPKDSHFRETNVLGMDALAKMNKFPDVYFNEMAFALETNRSDLTDEIRRLKYGRFSDD